MDRDNFDSKNKLEAFSPRIQALSEPRLTDREGNRFNPLSETETSAPDYSYLLSKDSDDYEKGLAEHQAWAQNQPQLSPLDIVMPKAIEAADQRLEEVLSRRGRLYRIYIKCATGNYEHPIDEFRGNHALRAAIIEETLGELLVLQASTMLPERVQRNDPDNLKRPDHPGYDEQRFTSHEYAAMLALTMLDGSFDDSKVSESELSQHTSSARLVLDAL